MIHAHIYNGLEYDEFMFMFQFCLILIVSNTLSLIVKHTGATPAPATDITAAMWLLCIKVYVKALNLDQHSIKLLSHCHRSYL